MWGKGLLGFVAMLALATALAACGGGGAKATATATLPAATATRVVVQQPTAVASPTAQVAGDDQYVVQAGDTLSSIAQQFGVTVQQIVDLNAIDDVNLILPGQTLAIPPK